MAAGGAVRGCDPGEVADVLRERDDPVGRSRGQDLEVGCSPPVTAGPDAAV